eukprot:scaffold203430_cov33-Prasinocladus_malaysianus.AAC.1
MSSYLKRFTASLKISKRPLPMSNSRPLPIIAPSTSFCNFSPRAASTASSARYPPSRAGRGSRLTTPCSQCGNDLSLSFHSDLRLSHDS